MNSFVGISESEENFESFVIRNINIVCDGNESVAVRFNGFRMVINLNDTFKKVTEKYIRAQVQVAMLIS